MAKEGNYKVEIVEVPKTYLGEGPHWDEKRQELLYVDLLNKTIIRYIPFTGQTHSIIIDEEVETGSLPFVIPIQSSSNSEVESSNTINKYVIGFNDSVKLLEWDGSSTKVNSNDLQTFYSLGNAAFGFNDGKCDRDGNLWTGSIPASQSLIYKLKGSLYNIKPDGIVYTHLNDDILIANGLAWSNDDKTFYYVDSMTYSVDAFDFNLIFGAISNRRSIFNLKTNNIDGVADGMCIDVEGNLWVAVFGAGKVLHINPKNGELIDWIEMPVKGITSCAFGGPNLDTLYITSCQFKVDKDARLMVPADEAEAGSLFKVSNTGTKGASGGIPFKLKKNYV